MASWDTASTLAETSNWSVGTVWGAVGLDYYLLDVVRGRLEFWELRREVVALSKRWDANVTLIEKTQLGHALLQDLRRTKALAPILVEPRLDKETRLLAQSARFEAGQVHLQTDASWLGEYLGELLAFRNGRDDDQVDATTYALHYLTGSQPRVEPRIRGPAKAFGDCVRSLDLILQQSLLWTAQMLDRNSRASSQFRPLGRLGT